MVSGVFEKLVEKAEEPGDGFWERILHKWVHVATFLHFYDWIEWWIEGYFLEDEIFTRNGGEIKFFEKTHGAEESSVFRIANKFFYNFSSTSTEILTQ